MRKPQTMEEVLQLSAEQFREVDDWMYGDKLSPKRLTRDMIRIIAPELEWMGRENSMSLRGLWYSGFKTAYQNAWPERWADPDYYKEGAGRKFSQYLSETLSEMVKDGEITYRELNILDDSRQRELSFETIEDDKILFVEKEAEYRRLLPLQRVFELSLVSGGGWEATALIEDLAYTLEDGQEYELFVLSDFDPTGYRIAEDFEDRAKLLGVNITNVERIGIEPDQVSERVRGQERFRPPVKSDYDATWMAEHAIDGEYGLELEAIGEIGEGGRPIREIVVNALRPYLRLRRRRQRDVNVATADTAYWGVNHAIEDLTENLEDALFDIAIDFMLTREAVQVLRRREDGGVSAGLDFEKAVEGGDEYVPVPLEDDDYLENAIEAPVDDDGEIEVVSPSRVEPTDNLKKHLLDQMSSGEVDVEELLGL